jgi:hypothetical protein
LSQSYYDLLGIEPTAPADEIKRAFRREIAKYHPDKVQHLGQEFQEIAASKAAQLTLAYKTLTDKGARAEYDAQRSHDGAPAPPPVEPPAPASPSAGAPRVATCQEPPAEEAPRPAAESPFAAERAGAGDLVRRAMLARFKMALQNEFGAYDEVPVQGFDITCIPKASRWSLKQPPRVVGRFVPRVDGQALGESWSLAARMKRDEKRELCVFVMGPIVAPVGELAAAITEQRRKPAPAGGKLIVVPVNTQTWAAHVPTDAPPVVKSVLSRLKTA